MSHASLPSVIFVLLATEWSYFGDKKTTTVSLEIQSHTEVFHPGSAMLPSGKRNSPYSDAFLLPRSLKTLSHVADAICAWFH